MKYFLKKFNKMVRFMNDVMPSFHLCGQSVRDDVKNHSKSSACKLNRFEAILDFEVLSIFHKKQFLFTILLAYIKLLFVNQCAIVFAIIDEFSPFLVLR